LRQFYTLRNHFEEAFNKKGSKVIVGNEYRPAKGNIWLQKEGGAA